MLDLTTALPDLTGAPCAADPDRMFPDLPKGRGRGPARRKLAVIVADTCAVCPVVAACEEKRQATDEGYGIWAGRYWHKGVLHPANPGVDDEHDLAVAA